MLESNKQIVYHKSATQIQSYGCILGEWLRLGKHHRGGWVWMHMHAHSLQWCLHDDDYIWLESALLGFSFSADIVQLKPRDRKLVWKQFIYPQRNVELTSAGVHANDFSLAATVKI